jgi:hypothetical protein
VSWFKIFRSPKRNEISSYTIETKTGSRLDEKENCSLLLPGLINIKLGKLTFHHQKGNLNKGR